MADSIREASEISSRQTPEDASNLNPSTSDLRSPEITMLAVRALQANTALVLSAGEGLQQQRELDTLGNMADSIREASAISSRQPLEDSSSLIPSTNGLRPPEITMLAVRALQANTALVLSAGEGLHQRRELDTLSIQTRLSMLDQQKNTIDAKRQLIAQLTLEITQLPGGYAREETALQQRRALQETEIASLERDIQNLKIQCEAVDARALAIRTKTEKLVYQFRQGQLDPAVKTLKECVYRARIEREKREPNWISTYTDYSW